MTKIDSIIETNRMIELGDGSQIAIPKLTNKKVLQLAKLLTGELSEAYYMVRSAIEKPVYYPKGTVKKDNEGNTLTDESGQVLYHDGSEVVKDSLGDSVTHYDWQDTQTVIEIALDTVSDELISKLISILLSVEEDQSMNMDIFDTIIILSEFLAGTNIQKAFLAITKLANIFTSSKEMTQSKAPIVPFTTTPTN